METQLMPLKSPGHLVSFCCIVVQQYKGNSTFYQFNRLLTIGIQIMNQLNIGEGNGDPIDAT
jgi:hypothetical protein